MCNIVHNILRPLYLGISVTTSRLAWAINSLTQFMDVRATWCQVVFPTILSNQIVWAVNATSLHHNIKGLHRHPTSCSVKYLFWRKSWLAGWQNLQNSKKMLHNNFQLFVNKFVLMMQTYEMFKYALICVTKCTFVLLQLFRIWFHGQIWYNFGPLTGSFRTSIYYKISYACFQSKYMNFMLKPSCS